MPASRQPAARSHQPAKCQPPAKQEPLPQALPPIKRLGTKAHWQRAPYMVLAGSLGLGSALLLSTMPPAAFTPGLALLLLLCSSASFAVPDVMLDATVAERCRLRPALTAVPTAQRHYSRQPPAAVRRGQRGN